MPASLPDLHRFLTSVHPYDAIPAEELARLVEAFELRKFSAGQQVYGFGDELEGLYLIHSGQIEIRDENDVPVSLLGVRNSFGERGLIRDGHAATTARALEETVLLLLPKMAFETLIETNDAARRFFDRSRAPRPKSNDLATSRVEELMTRNPISCAPDTTVQQAARMMRDKRIAALCVTEGDQLVGILSVRDLAGRVLADAMALDTPANQVMTVGPLTLPPSAIGSDVLHAMMERKISHIPICESGRLIGMVSQTDLTRFQAVSSGELVSQIVHADTAEDMAIVTDRSPQLLVKLVGAGKRHEVVTRQFTYVADTATRRLRTLAEEKLGPPPVHYLLLSCGSKGRQEHTGDSDQNYCMCLAATVTD